MNMKWVGRTVRKIKRFCRRNETMIEGFSFITFFMVFIFSGLVIGGLFH